MSADILHITDDNFDAEGQVRQSLFAMMSDRSPSQRGASHAE